MVCLHRDIVTSEPCGIYRTALWPDGSGKSEVPGLADPKKMMGRAKGAAIKLCADADVTTVLGIGEGVESTLSLRSIPECFGVPVWACMSAPALAAFPVLPGVETLWVAVDHDKAGIKAAGEVGPDGPLRGKRCSRSRRRPRSRTLTTSCGRFRMDDLHYVPPKSAYKIDGPDAGGPGDAGPRRSIVISSSFPATCKSSPARNASWRALWALGTRDHPLRPEWGQDGTGQSYGTVHRAGIPFAGRKVLQGPTVYASVRAIEVSQACQSTVSARWHGAG